MSMEQGISRRKFLAASGAVLGGAAIAAGMSTQIAHADEVSDGAAAAAAAEQGLAPTPWGDYYPWEATAPEITDDMVEEEIDCDVVVIGMGVAGCSAFRAAAEAGAKTIGIEKAGFNVCRSSQYCYLNGKLTEQFGLPYLDPQMVIEDEFEACASIPNFNIIRRFVLEENEAMDWWIEGGDCYVPASADEQVDRTEHPNYVDCMSDPSIDWENERQAAYPECLNFSDHQAVLDNNVQKGIDTGNGSEAYYGHFGEKLILSDDGAVIGAYARNSDTNMYKKLNAKNGVILTTGDCRGNMDMVRYFFPQILWNGNGNPWPNRDVEGVPTNTGDGYKLGYWAGAAITQYEVPQMHVMGGPGDTDEQMDSMGFTGPLLRINYDGKRFMNEDTCAADAEYPIELQPKHKCFMICDSHFEEQAAQCVNTFAATLDEWDARVGDDTIFKGETLEELFDSIDGMDTAAALETVEHYNELCETGEDTDYFKKQKYLFPVVDGPFYAQRMGVGLCLVTMGGLASDEEAHVLDLNTKPIPGLYASGNIQGNRVSIKYPFRLSGHSHAMAMFYGKVAGENAAAGK